MRRWKKSRNKLILGDHNVIDDLNGFKKKRSECRLRWDNVLVPIEDWEPRHPQDFLRARRDRQKVNNPRPELANSFRPDAGNLVSNGRFTSDSSWTKGTGWSIEDAQTTYPMRTARAACDGSQAAASSLSQTISVTSGNTYIVTFQIVAYTTGNVRPVLGANGTNRSSIGTFTETITASSTTFSLEADSTFVGEIGYVTVQ